MILLYIMSLDEIIFNKRQETTALKVHLSVQKTKKLIKEMPRPRRFSQIFKKGKIALIAEVKKASPSAGIIIKGYDPAKIAKLYQKAGASAISVITDEKYFKGRISDLEDVKAKTKLPVLRKDFIIDESQVYEARLAGADAILLIVRILSDRQLKDYLNLARSLKMESLAEAHNGQEIERALKAGAGIIGINNRDLDSLEVDFSTTLTLLKEFPELKNKIVVSESGISSAEQVRALKEAGVSGILVGESLLRSRDIGKKVKELLLVTWLMFCLSLPVWAMGSVPSTTEMVSPTIKYVDSFGFAGSGEKQFFHPQDVKAAVIGDLETGLGNIFVVDTGNNRIQRFDQNGVFLDQFGGFGAGAGKLNAPAGIAVDFNYRLYVSEKDNDRIQLFDIRGNYLQSVATDEINYRVLQDPAGMDVDSLGNFYIADSGNDRVLKFDAAGAFLGAIGGFGVGGGFLIHPLDVAVDRDRYTYVADTNNHRIQKFDFDGRPLAAFGKKGGGPGELLYPESIAIDDKLIYVSDGGNNRICVFTKSGKFILSFGEKGGEIGQFNHPAGISLGRKGELYIADSGNHRIVKLQVNY